METTKSETIEKLHGLRDDLAEIEAWVERWGSTSTYDDAGCCQEKRYHWFEVCDICIENGEAAKRLGDLAEGVIDLYNAQFARCKDRRAWGSYVQFVDKAASWGYDAAATALREEWSPYDDSA